MSLSLFINTESASVKTALKSPGSPGFLPNLVLGDKVEVSITLINRAGEVDSRSGNPLYTPRLAIGNQRGAIYAYLNDFEVVGDAWVGELNLATGELVGALSGISLAAIIEFEITEISTGARTTLLQTEVAVLKDIINQSLISPVGLDEAATTEELAAGLAFKVDIVSGKGLSTEDFSTIYRTKLEGIASGATANSSDSTLISRANHTGTQLANTISDFSSAVQSSSNSTQTVSSLTAPIIFAHRGYSNCAPDNSLYSFKLAAAYGYPIEMDVQLLADGSLGVMHDDTVDDTTDGTGNVSDYTAFSWKKLVLDVGLTNIDSGQHPPLFDEILREFEGEAILVVEIKNASSASATAILAMLNKYRVSKNHIIVQCFTTSLLSQFASAGYYTMPTGDDLVPATLLSQGATFVGVSSAVNQSYVQSLKAVGLKVLVYTINTVYDYNLAMALGADGVYSDDPAYVSGNTAQYKFASSKFNAGGLTPGMRNVVGPNSYVTWVNGKLVLSRTAATGFTAVTQGWAYPMATTATITFSATYTSASATDRWLGFYVGVGDRGFKYNGTTVSGENGYRCLIRKNGTLQIYIVTDGQIGAQLTTTAGTAIADGTTITGTLVITPSSITINRTDVAGTATTNNTTYRPLPFFQLETESSDLSWGPVTVS